MPQEMQILNCYRCQTFQVHIVKKSSKWACKICEEKQSIKKVYLRGSGKDCRLYVQELNQKRIEHDQEPPVHTGDIALHSEFRDSITEHVNVENKPNRWEEYMEETGSTNPDISSTSSDIQAENHELAQYTFERPTKKRKRQLSTKAANTDRILGVDKTIENIGLEVIESNAATMFNGQQKLVLDEKLHTKNKETVKSNRKCSSKRWTELISKSPPLDTDERTESREEALKSLNFSVGSNYSNSQKCNSSKPNCGNKWNIFLQEPNENVSDEIEGNNSDQVKDILFAKSDQTNQIQSELQTNKELNLFDTVDTDLDSIFFI